MNNIFNLYMSIDDRDILDEIEKLNREDEENVPELSVSESKLWNESISTKTRDS